MWVFRGASGGQAAFNVLPRLATGAIDVVTEALHATPEALMGRLG
ncbi:hypothetical protein [Nocardia cyriacigeorgica]|nr:hypothetical protein [Nocardia cyriacigeorgica]